MRKSLAVLFSSIALLAVTGLPALAAPPLDVSIIAEETIPASTGGTFLASGGAVATGLICPAGTTSNVVGPAHGTTVVTFRVDKTFTCTDGSGTFTARMNVRLDPVTGETEASWRVVTGSGSYALLRGTGKLIGVPIVVGISITDYYTGRLH